MKKKFLKSQEKNINPILSYDDPSPYELLGKGKYKRQVIFTPVGILPIMDHHYVSNNFNLWIGNTNFYYFHIASFTNRICCWCRNFRDLY